MPLYSPAIANWNSRELPFHSTRVAEDFGGTLADLLTRWQYFGETGAPAGIDAYRGFAAAPRGLECGTYRPSWLSIQAPSNSVRMGIARSLTGPGALPTNFACYARLAIGHRMGNVQNGDASVCLQLMADAAGAPDGANSLECYVTEGDTSSLTIQASRTVAGAVTNILEGSSMQTMGVIADTVLIQKLAGVFHYWCLTAARNWIYLGSYTPGFTIAWVGIIATNALNSAPGNMIAHCDFVRGYDGVLPL